MKAVPVPRVTSARVWHTSAPSATTTLNVIVDNNNNVTVKQIR